MKKTIIVILMLLLTVSLVSANGDGSHDGDGHEDDHMESMPSMDNSEMDHSMHEGSGFSHQVQMILPFTHFAEGHWFAGLMLTLMWVSLVYSIFTLFNK